MSAGGSIGMILDRALNLDLLDLALSIGTKHREDPQARRLLSVALRDVVTAQEAENKTKKVLTRVWVVPPQNAREMIAWAIEHQDEFIDRRALHYGALLATYPFFGSIATTVGRQIDLEGVVERRAVRIFARSRFGEREFIDAAASKSLATMRNLGILDGPKDGPYDVKTRLAVPSSFSSWFLHALILTRQVESARVSDLSRAFELTPLDLAPAPSLYPLLELHAENGSTVAVAHGAAG
ncbi:hypothetical protein [Mycobacterium sp. E2479]|uniref:hypothetical protein n=1 Tax=Mycobacterium sp. E2479 TaxID=1834134 RepID=UPI0007FD3754|nr:hypothetical protein [Mycobacterium sp. E2479]OBH51716.1 hypothetical protein A5686_11440 [Mycobacterium sp. E2479]